MWDIKEEFFKLEEFKIYIWFKMEMIYVKARKRYDISTDTPNNIVRNIYMNPVERWEVFKLQNVLKEITSFIESEAQLAQDKIDE